MSEFTARDVAATTPEELARLMAGPPEQLAPWARAAAEAGVVQAQAIYGRMLLDGSGVPRDPEMALTWLKRAGENGHADSLTIVGRCHDHGWGTEVDPLAATRWYARAAEGGSASGMFFCAHRFAKGVGGFVQDMHRAYGWYQRAADLAYPAAVGVVGRFHEDGEVVAQDVDFAYTCYRAAAEAGDGPSMFHYARLLYVRGHVEQAMTWFERVPTSVPPAFMTEARRLLIASEDPVLAAVYPASYS